MNREDMEKYKQILEKLKIGVKVDNKKANKYKYRVTFDIPVLKLKKDKAPERFWYFKTKEKALKFMKKMCYRFEGITGFLEYRENDEWIFLEYFKVPKTKPYFKRKILHIFPTERGALYKEERVFELDPIIDGKKIRKLLFPSIQTINKYIITLEDLRRGLEPKRSLRVGKRGLDLLKEGNYLEAVKCFDEELEVFSKDAEIWTLKGIALAKLELYDKAIKCFDIALEIEPEHPEALRSKGVSLANINRHKEALKYLDKYLEINPYDINIWKTKGLILAEMKNYDGAIKCYEKVLEICPADEEIPILKLRIEKERQPNLR